MSGRVFVSGGAGFIGSHLVDALVRAGFEVNVLDDLSSGSTEHIRGHIDGGRVHFVRGDIRDGRILREVLGDCRIVFHLAAVTSVPFSMEHPDITFDVNVERTRRLLEESLRAGVERFIYFSTCAVYGEAVYLPIDEKHPTNPMSPYAESKLRAEELCMRFYKKYGLGTTILRLFNVYGPRMRGGRYGGVIMSFVERLMAGEPPIIYGDGDQSRDFVHVADVVNAVMFASRSERAVGKIFNVGSGIATSIAELANLVMELFGVDGVEPIYMPSRRGDVRYSCADIGKLKTLLGYEPQIHLRDGLSSLLQHLKPKHVPCRLE